jgi:hypothetical protein
MRLRLCGTILSELDFLCFRNLPQNVKLTGDNFARESTSAIASRPCTVVKTKFRGFMNVIPGSALAETRHVAMQLPDRHYCGARAVRHTFAKWLSF